MFSRFITLFLVAVLATVVLAAPSELAARGSICSSGNSYCCNQKLSGPTGFTGALGELLSAAVGAGVGAGLTCTPISVIGTGTGGACGNHIACCGNDPTNGVANILCSPIGVIA